MSRLASVCPECGEVFERDEVTQRASCPRCHDATGDNNSTYLKRAGVTDRQRGYGYRWIKLSRRARKLQPFCSDCGSEDDLTADHTPEAWERHENGKSIRLRDIDVVCRSCNSERGAARGEKAKHYWRNRKQADEWIDL